MSPNKPIILTGFGDINYGKQYRLGNRVYDSNGIAMAICASPVGNMGGHSYLYLVKEKEDLYDKDKTSN